ncbi:ran-binding protein 10-like [Mucor ambiguus]|uniref:Ran-binding protein 10-like n=1 Tax=Mucor ambiguus TaxID=91626 RepID=A0A0C9LRX6_9FUNG|nr:ran-binding protein 10-like [Mucor ambiguus]
MASITPTYNASFPSLHQTGLISQRRASAHHHPTTPSFIQRSIAPPKFPSYLKQTLYTKLALEQYKFYQQKHEVKPLPSNASKKSSTTCLEEEQLEELDLRLPSLWNSRDKSKNIEIGSNGIDLSYIGPGKQETHAALARSNFPMRPQCGIFYYEMRVLSKGDDGYIGIGFCAASNKVERLPGWDPDSWGYHGDDGHSFAGSGTGKNYGPCFTTGDVIGCGVNFADNTAFYTKNGKFLGIAFTDMNLKQPIFPAVGLRTPGEQVTVNFGHEPFVFDIAQYVNDQRIKFIDEITLHASPKHTEAGRKEESYTKEVMDQLILSYLVHHGYTGTAKAVVQNAGHVSGQELFLSSNNDISTAGERDMEERQLIRSAIIHGHIDQAITLIDKYFPGVLQEEGRGEELQLSLKCGKFVEMMREYCECSKSRRLRTNSVDSRISAETSDQFLHANEDRSTRSNSVSGPATAHSHANPIPTPGRRLSYAAIAASLSPSNSTEIPHQQQDDSMDVDNETSSNYKTPDSTAWSRRPSTTPSNVLNGDHLSAAVNEENSTSSTEVADSLKLVMQYGQRLQNEYQNDTQKTRSKLVDIFSLLAYSDPYSSPKAHLLKISRRDALATDVNAAILAFQNRPEMPAMERIYRQIILCNKELAFEGYGKAALINIDDYCANDLEKSSASSNSNSNVESMIS